MKRFFNRQAAEVLDVADAFVKHAENQKPADPGYSGSLERLKEYLADIRPLLVAAPDLLDLLEEPIVIWGVKFATAPSSVSRTDLRDWM